MAFYKIITTILFAIYFLHSPAQNIDINLLKQINLNRNKALDGSFRNITRSVVPISIGTPIIIYAIGIDQNDSLSKQNGIYIAVTLLSSGIITTILKYSINRNRPFVTYPFIENISNGGARSPSFPSGHSSDAFALATSLSLTYQKWYVIIPSYMWAIAAGYSRMHLGVHYSGDVLAGALIGSGSAYLGYKGRKWLNKKTKYIWQ